jgi:hypothetical protein
MHLPNCLHEKGNVFRNSRNRVLPEHLGISQTAIDVGVHRGSQMDRLSS